MPRWAASVRGTAIVAGRSTQSLGVSMERSVICGQHGRQGIALVCTHIAHATDAGRKVGFFCGEAEEMARPDAWCKACEEAYVGARATSNGPIVPTSRSSVPDAGTMRRRFSLGMLTPNNAFGRTVSHRRPRLSAARSSSPAAQLGR